MWLRISSDLSFDVPEPSTFVMMLRPRNDAGQWIAREEYQTDPELSAVEFTDTYGNLCQRISVPAGKFAVRTRADVKTADKIDRAPGAPFVDVHDLPQDVMQYLLPSRYAESDRFWQMASEITADEQAGYDQVARIGQWVRESIRYEPLNPEISDLLCSATEVNERGSGVCRDLAHIGIALTRSLTIPARLVVGYLHQLEPMDMHAWFEAYVGNRWYTFDPTPHGLDGGYVAVGYGRDAADVAVFNQFGPPVKTLEQRFDVQALHR